MNLKQALPLTYKKDFVETTESGQVVKTHCTYRMWMGKAFHIKYTIK